jgi:FKBP-type peptidyl-prolyl cis-trans isomerase SlyD
MRKTNVTFLVLFCAFFAATVAAAPAGAAKNAQKGAVIADGKTVEVNYTLTVDGKVVDSSKGRKPLEFKAGAHQMIPGFEKALIGMKAGQKKSFKVKPEDGYGQVNPKAFREIPKKQLPAGVTPKAGMTLYAKGEEGQPIPIVIKEVKKDTVVLDFNHPLAGKTLNFDVEVVEVK